MGGRVVIDVPASVLNSGNFEDAFFISEVPESEEQYALEKNIKRKRTYATAVEAFFYFQIYF